MPTLNWIGKEAVVNHHRQVPYRLLHCDKELSAGDPEAGNLLVQGDNLLALKALLPYYAGKVKCIYIDPPYNTGNENWVYNDNVNSPEIRRWLGQVVGAEAEDLSRHDKWLCMMYPRLQLLQQLLRDDGAIFISIDDVEIAPLRLVLDEILGARNFLATICWEKIYTLKNTAKYFSTMHDYIVAYARNKDRFELLPLPRGEKQNAAFKNPDGDPRGPWMDSAVHARNYYSKGSYSVISPTGKAFSPPLGRYWTVSEENFKKLDAEGRIWWGKSGKNAPRKKTFVPEVKQGVVPGTIWSHEEAGTNSDAKEALRAILPDAKEMFITPKPSELIERILQIATRPGDLILDSFAGSGTTGQAVLHLKDGSEQRRFILVEMEETLARNVTAERLKRVINGYAGKPGIGGGFRYCMLGQPLFNEDGNIADAVRFVDLANHVFFSETGVPIPKRATGKSPLLGVHDSRAIYLLFNGVLGDRRPSGGNVLTRQVLSDLPPHAGLKVVYGEGCRLGAQSLRDAGVTFKQLPYAIKVD